MKNWFHGSLSCVKSAWADVSALRINYRPGCRVYYLQRGTKLIIFLARGVKSSQAEDIDDALLLTANLMKES
ncbi:MAG: hypothetical protein FJ077_11685 [Cyanobacteria bacterium K_DeepCast_35m_m2_023]|nr:hypothetical protein [Cyanobacteria bacterium K_DeepCast_35m_m2_023]